MEKEALKIVIIGHVDHGKSTTIGRLLLETNSLPKEKILEIKRISKELGKDTELAYLVDQLKEEREQNITIDTTQILFKTRKRNYIIIDAPGHVEFIKNMITGASLAQAAILIVDASEGLLEQTYRHAYLVSLLGIKKVIVACNKMDLLDYNQDKFEEIKSKLLRILTDNHLETTYFTPISAAKGVNIAKASPKLGWYRGPTLVGALDSLKLIRDDKRKPFRFSVQDAYQVDGEEIVVGEVSSGVVKQKDKVVFLPSFKKTSIKSIKLFKELKRSAVKGENIGLILSESLPIKRGQVAVLDEDDHKPTNYFKGNIFWMSNEPLKLNRSLTLRCSTQEVKCFAREITKRIDTTSLSIIKENAKEVNINEAGEVVFETRQPIILEKFSSIEKLGRFVLEDNYNLKGAGIVTEVIDNEDMV